MLYQIRLNNKSIYDIGAGVRVVDVTENEPRTSLKTATLLGGNGTRLLSQRRDSLTVTATLVLKEENIAKRTRLYEMLLKWARGGGYLTLDERPGQRLKIDHVDMPALGSVKKWFGTIDMTMTSYAAPYWESAFPSSASLPTEATAGATMLWPPGNADECPVDVTVVAGSQSVSRVTLTAGGTTMTLSGITLAAGKTLAITHTDEGVLLAKIDDASVLSARTAESDDELLLIPGMGNAVGFSADAPCTATFTTRGRWL